MMYKGHTIKTEEENADYILECLAVFEIWQNGQKETIYGHKSDEWHMFIGYSQKSEHEKIHSMKEHGEKYYNSGYRIKRTERHVSGISISVPDNAIAWVAVSAGHIATSEAFRIEYLIHISSETMTPSQVEKEFSLSPGTVRQYLKNHGEEMKNKGEAWKADSRTWLVLRTSALDIWGK